MSVRVKISEWLAGLFLSIREELDPSAVYLLSFTRRELMHLPYF